MYTCINLDGMSRSELATLDAGACHPLQVQYAAAKSTAMIRRLAGRISDALRSEAECERIYEAMPPSLRW